MRTIKCDVVIVGAGPGGSMAAKYCAQGGMDTLLIEKKAEIGAPLRCAEGVSKSWLDEVGIKPEASWIRADMKGAIIKSTKGTTYQLDESKAGNEVGYVLERHLFDKALARDAANAGAKIMMRTACTGIIREDGKIVGIKAKSMGEEIEIRCKAVVAADGYESQVARWAGIDTTLKLSDIDSCIQYRMCNRILRTRRIHLGLPQGRQDRQRRNRRGGTEVHQGSGRQILSGQVDRRGPQVQERTDPRDHGRIRIHMPRTRLRRGRQHHPRRRRR